MEWVNFVVVDPVKALAIKIFSYIPAVAGAIVILVVGWLLAKVIETVLVRVLKAIQLDKASETAGISKVLAQGDVKLTLSELVGALVYWLIILVVIATALGTLDLTIAADLVGRLAEYVPFILAAIFIIFAGTILANFVATIVRTATGNAGISAGKLLANITKTIIMIFTVVVAIEQLKIASTLLVLAVNIILISIGIGMALAFGLGCKDLAGKAVSNWLEGMKK